MPARSPRALRCEYRVDPLGLGTPRPRLFWRLDDERPGAAQSAYHVLVASERARLDRDEGDLWDSGRVASPENAHVEVAGRPLGSRTLAHWKVRSFDAEGQPSPWSAPARFELGLLEPGDWSADWIAAPLTGGPKTSPPVPALRREFQLDAGVASARLYVTALGLYEAHLNGHRVGDLELAPGWTDFRRRVRVQTYDVSDLLAPGPNALGVLLGDGAYSGFVGLRKLREAYGRRPALLAQLEITLEDGATRVVASGADWSWQTSAILASDVMQGETVDLRRDRELGAWTRAGGARGDWRPVDVLPRPALSLDAACGPSVRAMRELAPVAPPTRAGDPLFGPAWIHDLGQNMVGRVRLRVRGKRGATVVVRHAEALDERGRLYRENLRDAAATETYTLAGGDEPEILEPRFTFHGFRYVEVSGALDAIEECTGVVLHADLPETGEFGCSDPDVERLHRNIAWSQRGNFLDVPTDCPQRDERLGWTGDAQVFVRTAAFHMEVAPFFAKWLRDLEDAQRADGLVPSVAPAPPGVRFLAEVDGGPAWGDAVVLCPWTVWRCHADRRLLAERWGSMAGYVDFLAARCPDGIRADPAREGWGGYGDWCALDGTNRRDSRLGGTPKDLIGTAFFAHSARRLAEVANALGRRDDEKHYAELAARVRDAFRRRFVTPDGLVAGNTQTSCALALHFDLLEPHERARTGAALARSVEEHGHLTTGFVGTPVLLPALTAIGRLDLAYRLLLRRDYPGWLFPVVEGGATTIWERWNGWTKRDGFFDPEMNSFNHYAYGAVGEWLYGTVAGLDLDPAPEASGWRRARIAPRPPLHPGLPMPPLLTRARAALDTLHGRFEVAWHVEDGAFRLDVRVPPGCSAGLALPDGTREELTAGRHARERDAEALRAAP